MPEYLQVLAGILGAILTVGTTLPQLIRILRLGHAEGVSTTALATGLVSGSSWATYGFLANQTSVGITGCMAAVQLGATLHAARRRGASRTGLRPIGWAAGLAAILALAGPHVLGLVLAVSALMNGLPQLRLARSGADLMGVSAIAWGSALVEGFLWLAVGAATADTAVLIWALGQLLVSVPILWRVRADRRASTLMLAEEHR